MADDREVKVKTPGWIVVGRWALAATALAAMAVGVYLASTNEGTVEYDPFRTLSERSLKEPELSAGARAAKEAADPLRPTSLAEAERSIATNLVGDRACAECHPGEAAYHRGSGHSKTLRPAPLTAIARWLDGRKVQDPENPEVSWTYALADDRLEVEREEGGRFHCMELEYAVGSGVNGTTFVSTRPERTEGLGATGFEHRLSYFANGPKVDISPGQAEADGAKGKREIGPHGRTLDEVALDKCLRCHATLTGRSSEAGVDPAVLRPNVGCERCHGPGKDHIEAARRGAPEAELKMPHGSAEVTPVHQINLCGECHRRLDNVPQSQVDPRNPEISRFQPLGLQLSACFQSGSTGLKCTSCHDPHAKVKRDTAAYEKVCLGCHNALNRSLCPVSTAEGCIGCHMPKRTVSVDFSFHDHWIRRPPKEKPAAGR